MSTLPVLELDDGTCIAESVAICRYFKELYPEPPMMGVDAKDCAIVEMWNRRMAFEIFWPIADAFRHRHEPWTLPIPARFVIDSGGTVVAADADPD